jgi:hypothetical protein
MYRSAKRAAFWVEYHVIWCPKYRRRMMVGLAEDWSVSTVLGASLEVLRRYAVDEKRAG